MTRLQLTVIGSAVLFFLVLYFGCDTKPKEQQALEKSRALAAKSTDINNLLGEAKDELSTDAANAILSLEKQMEDMVGDTAKLPIKEQLSGLWFDIGYPAISGFYAQQIAETLNTGDSWSIAGTTYTICIQRTEVEKVKQFCSSRAVQAFENAISLAPENINHKVNLALCYTEAPPQDNPMKGILMLVELNKAEPDNVIVLNTLARLAIRTGQFGRAVERLESALRIEPENIKSVCLMAQAQEGLGETEQAALYAQKCNALNQN